MGMKRKTYYNFMRVVKMMQAKGYDFDESVKLAHLKFEELEANPGRCVEDFVNMVLDKPEYMEIYREV